LGFSGRLYSLPVGIRSIAFAPCTGAVVFAQRRDVLRRSIADGAVLVLVVSQNSKVHFRALLSFRFAHDYGYQ
jgi:hypothetical protein